MSEQQLEVNCFPDCDICRRAGRVRAAGFYAKTRQGRWGYVCSRHFVGEGCVIVCKYLLDTAPKGRSDLIKKERVMAWE